MTIQTILQGDIPELRQNCIEVTSFGEDLHSLLDDLVDTLQARRGLGLAAPQIGFCQRVMVIDVGQGVQEFVNPEILESSGTIEGYESCLSFPEHSLKITRPKSIRVQAQDRHGQTILLEAKDLMCRIISHEIDHLNGILFMDHLSEEEMFSQLLSQSFMWDDDESEDADTEINLKSDALEDARREEIQLAADMLAEVSWKLTLSLEILKDYPKLFATAINWKKLQKISNVLEETVSIVERSLDVPQS